jgi:hypothetical protein
MKIKILGPGCVNCLRLELLAAQAAKELGIEAEIEKVTDTRAFSRYNIQPPAIVLNEKVVAAGLPLPSLESLMGLLKAK